MSSYQYVKNIYIHLPFCRRRCIYCDFYSEKIGRDIEPQSDYIEAVIREFEIYREYLSDKISTVYIGGGTPSVLPTRLLKRLLSFLKDNIICDDEYEFTFEMNPESVKDDILQMIREYGANRISLGVQSLNDKILIKLGRVHNREDVFNALLRIIAAGFKNVSVDFLIGTIEDSESILKNIEILLSNFFLVHISCYLLTLKKTDSKCASLISRESTAVDQYKSIHYLLKRRGYLHYEISNFALSGYQSLHNINYWDCGEYIGLGASAAGHYINQRGERIRYKNISDIKRYIKSVCKRNARYDEFEVIDNKTHINEIIMLGIRKASGIYIGQIESLLNRRQFEIFLENAKRLQEDGLVKIAQGKLSPTLKGFIFNNQIAKQLMF